MRNEVEILFVGPRAIMEQLLYGSWLGLYDNQNNLTDYWLSLANTAPPQNNVNRRAKTKVTMTCFSL